MNAEMPIVVLAGAPFERGVAHGSRFQGEISAILQRDLYSLPEEELSEARRRATVAFEAIRALSPQVAEELAGIAEGAGRTVPEIVLRSGFELLTPVSETGCSALVTRTRSGAIAAQNWDGLPSKHSDLALFLHFSPSGFQFAVVASFGGLGFAGMNNRGLSLVNNDLILKGSRDGIPSQVVRRVVLDLPNVKSAADRISLLPHMGGRSYLLADRTGEIAAVEVSPRSGANFLATSDIHLHTNNALLPVTRTEEDTKALLGMYPSSAARLSALRTAVERVDLSVDGVKQVLRDESGAPDAVCKTASANELTETAFSIVMDCFRGEMHLASGKPSVNAYRKIVLPVR
ncbi:MULTISPECIES: C45 family peptidase [unclassified Mesorhizobium]|uniref:C45 family autoproteolytic acyltransferase/hydolase n=1 Tax=unclassified Mesorhizobium TaxID=325217 RepID=UPI0011297DA1|nr:MULTISPECIES: C45 family peptidase [unclassified Mesorhizobium]TPK95331.1 acyl-CoA-6-aminopenicillanic acid acyltransferase [Mesorhizobium sp. B2-4-16]TPL61025.1 acyl-CoA-6-aminopenicillanic acid acyltransferase [Mesorhizobium sp. B2-4-3]